MSISKNNMNNMVLCLTVSLAVIVQGLYADIQTALFLVILTLMIKKPRLDTKQLAFSGVMILGLLFSDIVNGFGHNSLYDIAKVLVLMAAISAKDDKEKLLFGLYIGCVTVSVVGIFAFMAKSNIFELTNVIDGRLLLQGTLGYANTTAVICGTGMVLSVYYIKIFERNKFMNEIGFAINTVAFIMTGSLFAFAALFGAVVLITAVKYKKVIPYIAASIVLIMAFVAVLFFTGKESLLLRSAVASRLIYWQDAIKVIINKSFGIGVGAWQDYQYKIQSADYSVKYVHNSILQLMLDGGIICGLTFLLGIILMVKSFVKKYKRDNEMSNLAVLAILIFAGLHILVDIDLAYGAIWLIFGICGAFLDAEGYYLKRVPTCVIITTIALIIIALPPSKSNNSYADKCTNLLSDENYEELCIVSKEWLSNAPRHQAAYDMRYIALKNTNRQQELIELEEKKNEINKTMNKLCRYLTAHKEIVLPEVEK